MKRKVMLAYQESIRGLALLVPFFAIFQCLFPIPCSYSILYRTNTSFSYGGVGHAADLRVVEEW